MGAAAASARGLRALAAAALCLVLAACFVSAGPLIGPEETVTPLQPGVYAFHDAEAGEAPEVTWRGEISFTQDGVMTSPAEGFDYQGARMAVLRPGVWIVQHPPEDGEQDEGYAYTLLYADTETEGRYYAELPVCEALSLAVQASLGLELVDDVCTVDSLDTLRDALLAYEVERADDFPAFPEGRSYLVREGDL